MVVAVVVYYQYLAFAVKVEVGETDVTVLWKSRGGSDGLIDRNGVLGRIGAADNIYVVDGVAAYQFLPFVAKHVAGQRHGEIASMVIDNTYGGTSETETFVAVCWT